MKKVIRLIVILVVAAMLIFAQYGVIDYIMSNAGILFETKPVFYAVSFSIYITAVYAVVSLVLLSLLYPSKKGSSK